nr:hypothetical protein [Tanacetum cinerariifolium]
MKKYDYGHVEEIKVRRDDQHLYTFKEGDFKRLRLHDIEDMLLLLVQQKLTNLIIDKQYDLNVALRMYTRRIVIQRRVEDLQLSVESYQKKLNLSKPDTYRSNLRNKTAYTSYSDPHGIIYVDQFKRKRLVHADELHKFSDGTLNDEIDKHLYQRRLMQNLKKFVGGRDQRDLPRDISLDSVEVLRYEKRSKSDNKGKVPIEIELVLEQTQQALTVDGLAALTLGGEMIGLEEGCQMKGLLRGDLDLDTTCEAMLGGVLKNFSLTALIVLAAVVSTGWDLEDAAAETLCKGNLELEDVRLE